MVLFCRKKLPVSLLLAAMFFGECARAGDWATFRGDYSRTNRSDAQFDAAALAYRWSSPEGYTDPIVIGDTVVAIRSPQSGPDPRLITGFDLYTGAQRWSVQYTSHLHAPAVLDGLLYYYVGDAPNPVLTSRQPHTGALIDQQHLSDAANGGALTLWHDEAGQLHQYSASGEVAALTGDAIVKSYPQGASVTSLTSGARTSLFLSGISSGSEGGVAVYDAPHKHLFITDAVGRLHAFDYESAESVTPLWTRNDIGSNLGRLAMAVAQDGSLYALPGSGNALIQVDAATGQTLRSTTIKVVGFDMAIQGNDIWVNTAYGSFGDSQLTAFSVDTLQPLVNLRPQPSDYTEFIPAAFGDQQLIAEIKAFSYRRFDVYSVPEPASSAAIALLGMGALNARRRGRGHR